jgi:hypothetical protein
MTCAYLDYLSHHLFLSLSSPSSFFIFCTLSICNYKHLKEPTPLHCRNHIIRSPILFLSKLNPRDKGQTYKNQTLLLVLSLLRAPLTVPNYYFSGFMSSQLKLQTLNPHVIPAFPHSVFKPTIKSLIHCCLKFSASYSHSSYIIRPMKASTSLTIIIHHLSHERHHVGLIILMLSPFKPPTPSHAIKTDHSILNPHVMKGYCVSLTCKR